MTVRKILLCTLSDEDCYYGQGFNQDAMNHSMEQVTVETNILDNLSVFIKESLVLKFGTSPNGWFNTRVVVFIYHNLSYNVGVIS